MSCDQSRGPQLRMCGSSAHGVWSVVSSGNATATNGTRTGGSGRVSPLLAPPHAYSSHPTLRSPSRDNAIQVSPGRSRRSAVTPSQKDAVPTPARLMVCPRPPSVNGILGPHETLRKRPGPAGMVTQREVPQPDVNGLTFQMAVLGPSEVTESAQRAWLPTRRGKLTGATEHFAAG